MNNIPVFPADEECYIIPLNFKPGANLISPTEVDTKKVDISKMRIRWRCVYRMDKSRNFSKPRLQFLTDPESLYSLELCK